MDGIDAVSLKAIATHIYKPLTHLVNLSIYSIFFAKQMEISQNHPIAQRKREIKT